MRQGGRTGQGPAERRSTPLRARIIERLRAAIEAGALRPGDRLIEKELCEQLKVSRTSLREALRELQADGILQQASNRSLVIAPLSIEDAYNAYRTRTVVEALLIEQFVERAQAQDMARLADAAAALRRAYQVGDVGSILPARRAFCEQVYLGSGNPIAADILKRLALRTSSLRGRAVSGPERQARSIERIDRLMAAIGSGDSAAARAAAAEHIADLASFALTVLAADEAQGA